MGFRDCAVSTLGVLGAAKAALESRV